MKLLLLDAQLFYSFETTFRASEICQIDINNSLDIILNSIVSMQASRTSSLNLFSELHNGITRLGIALRGSFSQSFIFKN